MLKLHYKACRTQIINTVNTSVSFRYLESAKLSKEKDKLQGRVVLLL